MEQTVWLYFGVISVLVGLVIITQLVSLNVDREKQGVMQTSLDQMANFCDFICLSDLNQFLSQEVKLASGSHVYSTDLNGLCFEFKDQKKCRPCKCRILDANAFPAQIKNFDLNLAKPEIIPLYDTHSFSCSFLREREAVTLACTG